MENVQTSEQNIVQKTNQLSQEQINYLKDECYSSSIDIEKFLHRLNNNYGDGEVLNSAHIINIFDKGFNIIDDVDYLTIYIDTLRMLKSLNRDEVELLELIDFEEVQKLHNELSQNDKTEYNENVAADFLKATEPFKDFKQVDGISVELIETIEELNYEGSFMEHCIASYFQYVIDKNYIGFRVTNNNERLTLGCYRRENNLFFNQLKGKRNLPASSDSCKKIIEFCKINNILIPDTEVYDLLPAINNQ